MRMRKLKVIYVAIYVDDLIIAGSDTKGIQHLRDHMIQTFGGTTGVMNSFLNLHMKYEKQKGRMEMRHAYYRRKIFENHNLSLDIRANSPYFDEHTSTMKWTRCAAARSSRTTDPWWHPGYMTAARVSHIRPTPSASYARECTTKCSACVPDEWNRAVLVCTAVCLWECAAAEADAACVMD
jgi:hypothetical protein